MLKTIKNHKPEAKTDYPPLPNPPYHVGIIMDGNGRWAQRQGKSRYEGHKAGTENLRRILKYSVEFGVKMLTIYAFSTENWGRPTHEVRGLMMILERVLDRELMELHENGVQLRHLGELGPEGANVHLVARGDRSLSVRTFERGVEGETLACGSGCMATAFAFRQAGIVDEGPVEILTRSGARLTIEFLEAERIRLSGPAVHVFDGVFPDPTG